MKRVATVLAILSAVLLSLGKNPVALMASGYVLLVLMGFGKLIMGDKKPFGQPFWVAVFLLLIAPFFICQLILTIGWPYIIIGLALSALIYIYFNTDRNHTPKINGGERNPIDHHFGEYSWNEFDEN
jgi:hypothetical protein